MAAGSMALNKTVKTMKIRRSFRLELQRLFFVIVICILLLCEVEAKDRNFDKLQPPEEHSTGFCRLFVPYSTYTCAEFSVETRDGYLLGLQRIGSESTISNHEHQIGMKGPVLLHHGIMQGGEIWMMNPGEESLPLMMASAGFDVWVANSRSSGFSFGHKIYSKQDKEFWDWSWDDLVKIDLPTLLQFVHDRTREFVYYVGFSQGTMTGLATFSKGSTVNLVAKAALLSPISSLNHVTSPVVSGAALLYIDEILLMSGVTVFRADGEEMQQYMNVLCGAPGIDCENDLMSQITGPNCCFNSTRLPFYEDFELQPTSMRNMAQMAQMVRSGKFSEYDYGFVGNSGRYFSATPPEYDVSAIPASLPILLVHGGNDAIGDPIDVANLVSKLKGDPQILYLPNYGHADFVMGTTVHIDVYAHIIEFFQA